MKRIKWLFPALLLGLLLSCTKTPTSALYVPVSSDATASATLLDLQQGRTLYMNNCGSCHSLYSPDDYSKGGWTSILSTMAPKTSMNASQVTLVTKYVTRGL
jgi:mono/diheme cytochrome c family protein